MPLNDPRDYPRIRKCLECWIKSWQPEEAAELIAGLETEILPGSGEYAFTINQSLDGQTIRTKILAELEVWPPAPLVSVVIDALGDARMRLLAQSGRYEAMMIFAEHLTTD